VPGNSGAHRAKAVAERLDVPWTFFPSRRRDMRRLLSTEDCRRYWEYSDGMSVVPNPQDFDVMLRVVRDGRVDPEALLVNGQSGDFTSGGHVSPKVMSGDQTFESLCGLLIDKHFDLWLSLKTPEALAMVRRRIARSLDFDGDPGAPLTPAEAGALLERWEHQERQARYVINQQRTYEFLGYDWRLPLWDMALVDFWRGVPVAHKIGQALYKTYLRQWNYKGLFTEMPENVSAWGPRVSWFMIPISSVLHKLTPKRKHRALQKFVFYPGRLGHHYSAFPFAEMASVAGDIRGPMALYTRRWLQWSGVPAANGPDH